MSFGKKFLFLFCLGTMGIFLSVGTSYAKPLLNAECATGGCTVEYDSPQDICFFDTMTEANVGKNDPSHSYPYGLFDFSVGDCPEQVNPQSAGKVHTKSILTTTVTLNFYDSQHNTINMEGYTYRKYGKTPDNHSPHWYDFMYDGTTGAEIVGNSITLHFVDGERGDDDITVNTLVVDQGGPGQQEANIPTMTEWGMIIFTIFAGLGAVYYLRRQKTAKN